jgi:hypothetical protein
LDELGKEMEKHYRLKKFKFRKVESKTIYVDKLSYMQRPTTLSITFGTRDNRVTVYWNICFQKDNFKLSCGNDKSFYPICDPNSISNMKRYITEDINEHEGFLKRPNRW